MISAQLLQARLAETITQLQQLVDSYPTQQGRTPAGVKVQIRQSIIGMEWFNVFHLYR
jgi:hypothetical protein